MRPQKEDPIRVQLAIGLNRIEYPVKVTTKTADITTFKIHINSLSSTRGLRYARWDIGNYYLEIPMGWSEYMRIRIRLISPDIITHYNLNNLVYQDGWIYMVIIQGIYLPPQAGIFANNLLLQRLRNHGYCKIKKLPELWQHEWRPISITLIVDDVIIVYFGRDHESDKCTQNI